jgi:hypothetical protein
MREILWDVKSLRMTSKQDLFKLNHYQFLKCEKKECVNNWTRETS